MSPDDLEIVEGGQARDLPFVGRLSREVFSHFGDYETILTIRMLEPDVETLVAELGGRKVGFAMLDLAATAEGWVELVAIAVATDARSRGIGRALLSAVEARARTAVASPQATVLLTVALENRAARRLFEGAGYERVPGKGGRYDGGQLSMDMRRVLVDVE